MFAIVAVSKGHVEGIEHIFAAETRQQVLSYISLKWNSNQEMLPLMQDFIPRSEVDTPAKLEHRLKSFNSRSLSYWIVEYKVPVVHVDRVVLDSIVPVEDWNEDMDDEDMDDPEGDVDTEPGSPPEPFDDEGDIRIHIPDGEMKDRTVPPKIIEEDDEISKLTNDVLAYISEMKVSEVGEVVKKEMGLEVLASVPRSALPECPAPFPKAQLRPASSKLHLRTRAVEPFPPPHLLRARTTPLKSQYYAIRYQELDGVSDAPDFIVHNRISSLFEGSDLFGYVYAGNTVAIVYETRNKAISTFTLGTMEELQQTVCRLPSYVPRFTMYAK